MLLKVQVKGAGLRDQQLKAILAFALILAISLLNNGCIGVTGSDFTISKPSANNISANATLVSWTSSAPATSQVEFGTSTGYGLVTPLDLNLVMNHAQGLSGLAPGTLYHYRVRSRNANNAEVVSPDATFTTVAAPDTTPPVISAVNAVPTANSVTVSWTTDEPSDSQVEFGTTTSYGQSSLLTLTAVTSHSVSLAGLNASTLYHYRVKSRDAAGNLATSADFTFTTTALADTTAPSVSITSPAAGATVSGTISVSASASDNVGVVRVQFKVDGVNLGAEDTASPYSVSLDTTALSNSSHTLAAVARDAAGNAATSAAVSINVSNTSTSGTIVRVGPSDPWCNTINSAAPGTTIILAAGNYSTTCWISAQGTATAPIIIQSATQDLSARAVFNYSGNTANLTELVGAAYVTLRWLSFGPSQDGVDAIRIQSGVHDVVIEQCLFQGIGGISIPDNSGDTQRITVRDNTFRNLQGTALYFGCHDGLACHATEILIERNLIDGVMPLDASVGYGLEIKLNSYGTVRDNTVYRTKGPGINIYGSNRGDPPSIVEGNYVEASSTDAGINISGGPAIVRNNVLVGNANGGIWAQDYNSRNLQQNVWIVNNTVLNNQTAGIIVQNWQVGRGNVLAYNAIAPRSGTPALSPSSPAGTVVGNITCSPATVCFDQPTTAPYDLWPLIGGPLIDAAGSGTEAWRPVDDFMGVPRGTAADVGAFERNSSGTGPLLGGGAPRPPRVSTSTADTTPPSVSITAPSNGATVSGTIAVTASASDNVGVVGVQFKVDGVNTGAEDTVAPYSYSLNTTTLSNGSHSLTATARDAAGNAATSAAVTINVSNGTVITPPVISAVAASNLTSSSVTITWTTDKASDSQVEYGLTTSYGSSTPLDSTLVTSHSVSISGLVSSTLYHYRVNSRDSSGNLAVSADFTFTTLAPPPPPPSAGGGPPATLGWYQAPNTWLKNVCPPVGDNQPSVTSSYNFPFYCQNVIGAWNGAIADTKRNRLIIWGGGHNDYYGNEIYSFDIGALTLTRLNRPSPINSNTGSCPETLSDGLPNSRHTYSGLAYIQHADKMYAFGGSLACASGSPGNGTWTLDLATLQWQRMDPVNGGPPVGVNLANISDYDPNTKLVYLNDRDSLWSYNYDTNTYMQLGRASITLFMNAVIDPKRRLFIMVGTGQSSEQPSGSALQVINIAPGSNYAMQDWTSQVTGCSGMFVRNPGLAYDSVQDRIVVWGGGDTAYLFNPDTKSCTTQTFSGGPGMQENTGTYGRWRYFPTYGVFALVNDWQQNAFTLRITAQAPVPVDTVPPVISSVSSGSISSSGAVISWVTDELADGQVDYGLTTTYGQSTALNSVLLTAHSEALSGLSASTFYHYRVRSRDAAGNLATSPDFTFTTAAPPASTAFTCTKVLGFSQTRGWFGSTFEGIASPSGDTWERSAPDFGGIERWVDPNWGGWTTGAPGEPSVPYSPCTTNSANPDRVLINITSVPDTSYLPPNCTGCTTTYSGIFPKSVAADWVPDILTVISNIRAKYSNVRQIILQPLVGGPGHQTCFIGGTPVRASVLHPVVDQAIALVVGGDVVAGASPEVRTCADYADTLGHLTTDGYTYQMNSLGTFYASFNPAPVPVADTTPPVISNVAASGITDSQATVSWTTNEPADAQVDYGVTSAYGQTSLLNSVLGTSHAITLSGLSASTLYHYRVRSRDAAGNLSLSTDFTFTTTALPPPPPVQSSGAPVLFFSDLDSSPSTGNSDTSLGQVAGQDGAIVSVWGAFLGDSQGTSKVFVNGAEARVYYWGRAVPPYSPANLYNAHQKLYLVIFQVGHLAASGAGQITVQVNGAASNPLPFTVRAGNVFFLKTTGSDSSGNGSWTSPWRTINYAKHQIAPGDIIYVGDGVNQTTNAGNYLASFAVDLDSDGQLGNPKALVTYPGAQSTVGSLTLDGFHWYISGLDRPSRYWTVAKFNVLGDGTPISANTGYRLVANHVSAPNGTGATGTLYLIGSDIAIYGNEFTNCGASDSTGSFLYHTMYISGNRNGTTQLPTESNREIAWNYIHDNQANRAINIYSQSTNSAHIEGHRVHHNAIVNQRGDGILVGFYVTGENWVYNNLIVNAGLGPDYADGGTQHTCFDIRASIEGLAASSTLLHIYNNTLYGCGWSGGGSSSGAFEFTRLSNYTLDVHNNIIYTSQPYLAGESPAPSAGAAAISNNLWFGAGAAPSWDSNALNADPLFVSVAGLDFHVQSTSPAIDRGIATLSSVITIDFDGIPRPLGANYELGAFEFIF